MLKADIPRRSRQARGDLELQGAKDLVGPLYASTPSLAAGVAAGSAMTVFVAAKAGLWPLTMAAALVCLVGAGRLGLRLSDSAAGHAGRGPGEIWTSAYPFGATGYCGLLGLFAMLTVLLARDPALHMLAATMAVGYAAGIAGRNAGRPKLAIAQLTLAALPISVALLLTPIGPYRMLGVMTLLVYAGAIDILLQSYRVVLRAFKRVRETEAVVEAAQIRASQACAANEAKTRFLANMSHEIRTPLNGVIGMTEAMLAEPLADQQRARLKVIRQSGGALLTLLNDILDLSKVEAGKLDVETAPFHLGELLESVAGAFRDAALARGIEFSVFAREQDLGMYNGDGGRLRQILFNLISNALKFTEKGCVEVKVAFTGETLEMAVSDTGIGIAPEHLDRLFERFSQADASTPRRFGGTGLGLAICQELTGLLSGRIWAESQFGSGATFFVSLPIVRLNLAEPDMASSDMAVEVDSRSMPKTTARRVRLLCAEDNDVNRMVLRALLEPLEYDLMIVDNGLQALEAYRRDAFDLILLDVQMPVMDGPSAATAIRLFETSTKRPSAPIIALTANVMADQVQGYMAAGMDQVIAKPVDIDELYAAIECRLSSGPYGSAERGDGHASRHGAVAG